MPIKQPPFTLIGIQEEYIAKINGCYARWGERRDHGYTYVPFLTRVARGARRTAERKLLLCGYRPEQIPALIKDAIDMASLERLAE